MKILYVAMRYDYGLPSRGESFEHYNFYEPLRDMGHDILYFDFMTLLEEHGRRAMNRRLLDVCRSEKPDVLFSCLFKDELEKETLRDISAPTTLSPRQAAHCRSTPRSAIGESSRASGDATICVIGRSTSRKSTT